jgi:hypothetical protein
MVGTELFLLLSAQLDLPENVFETELLCLGEDSSIDIGLYFFKIELLELNASLFFSK